jgi:hypothetical protein
VSFVPSTCQPSRQNMSSTSSPWTRSTIS